MESHIMGDKGKCNKYQKVLDIINKMMEEKYDAQEAKCILGYRKGNTYAAAAKNNKREETRSE